MSCGVVAEEEEEEEEGAARSFMATTEGVYLTKKG